MNYTKKKTSVLVIVDSLGFGGAERLIANLIPLLVHKKNYLIDILILEDPDDLAFEFLSKNIHVYNLKLPNKNNIIKGLLKFYFLKLKKYDVIWGHLYHGNLYAALIGFLYNIEKIIITLHGQCKYSELNNNTFKFYLRRFVENIIGKFFATDYHRPS